MTSKSEARIERIASANLSFSLCLGAKMLYNGGIHGGKAVRRLNETILSTEFLIVSTCRWLSGGCDCETPPPPPCSTAVFPVRLPHVPRIAHSQRVLVDMETNPLSHPKPVFFEKPRSLEGPRLEMREYIRHRHSRPRGVEVLKGERSCSTKGAGSC
jgi:hypothetical protein